MSPTKGRTGTREWSDHSVNCCLGCRHACLYCYARELALRRFRKITKGEDWSNERIDADALAWILAVGDRRHKGRVMFPTQHDITAGNSRVCMAVLVRLLAAGNDVLVVSKAGLHVPTLLYAARALAGIPDRSPGQLELRVTLTCLDRDISAFWEPGAPPPQERLDAIALARQLDIPVSVAIEPLLEPSRILDLVNETQLHGARGEIWIGAANQLRARTAWCANRPCLGEEVRRIEAGQTPAKMREVFDLVPKYPTIRWKDSFQGVLGIDAFGKCLSA